MGDRGGNRTIVRKKGSSQLSKLLGVAPCQFRLNLGDAGLLAARLEVIAQAAQRGNGQRAIFVGDAQQAQSVDSRIEGILA